MFPLVQLELGLLLLAFLLTNEFPLKQLEEVLLPPIFFNDILLLLCEEGSCSEFIRGVVLFGIFILMPLGDELAVKAKEIFGTVATRGGAPVVLGFLHVPPHVGIKFSLDLLNVADYRLGTLSHELLTTTLWVFFPACLYLDHRCKIWLIWERDHHLERTSCVREKAQKYVVLQEFATLIRS